MSVYCATKAFLYNYSLSLYMELMDKGIAVQVLCPVVTQTDFAKNYYSKEAYEQMSKAFKHIISPEKAVDDSLHCLQKNKLVCFPGLQGKVMAKMVPFMPIKMYYNMVTRMTPFK